MRHRQDDSEALLEIVSPSKLVRDWDTDPDPKEKEPHLCTKELECENSGVTVPA